MQKWAKTGGYIDFTAEDEEVDNACLEALRQCKADGVPMTHVTLSSDAYGSFPFFGDDGQVISYGVGKPDTLLYMLKLLVTQHSWTMEEALSLITKNVASIYLLNKKGQIQVGSDGDLVLLDTDFKITHVFAKGKEMLVPGWVKKAMFEE
jgi:beta-aspartyl-dipeptidase (metallo-type)